MDLTAMRLIAISDLLPDLTNARPAFDPDDTAEVEFRASLRAHGVLIPLLVGEPVGGGYPLIEGHRRLANGRLVGLAEFPCRVLPGLADPAAVALVQVIANVHREPLPDLELAEKLAALRASTGWTQKELAGRLHRSEAEISRLFALLALPPRLRELYRAGKLPKSVAATAAAAGDAAAQKALAERYVRGELDRDGVVAARRRAKPGATKAKTKPPRKRTALPLPGGVTVTVDAPPDLTPATFTPLLKTVIAAADRADKQSLGLRHLPDLLRGMAKSDAGGPPPAPTH